MKKRLFTGDHPNVATSLNNLARLYYSQGQYSEAEPLYIDALAMCNRVLGVEHLSTVTVQKNLLSLRQQRKPRFKLMGRLGWFVGVLVLPFFLLWLLVKII